MDVRLTADNCAVGGNFCGEEVLMVRKLALALVAFAAVAFAALNGSAPWGP
jgi:hypothetical protein